jgi:hypothetical protein
MVLALMELQLGLEALVDRVVVRLAVKPTQAAAEPQHQDRVLLVGQPHRITVVAVAVLVVLDQALFKLAAAEQAQQTPSLARLSHTLLVVVLITQARALQIQETAAVAEKETEPLERQVVQAW